MGSSIRLQEFEILKALLIISIVVGHAVKTPYVNVFWYHVPGFFMLTGHFMKVPKVNPITNKQAWMNRLSRYVIPYFAYSVLFYLLFQYEPLTKNISRALLGGGYNIGLYSYPYWFINALLVGGGFLRVYYM